MIKYNLHSRGETILQKFYNFSQLQIGAANGFACIFSINHSRAIGRQSQKYFQLIKQKEHRSPHSIRLASVGKLLIRNKNAGDFTVNNA